MIVQRAQLIYKFIGAVSQISTSVELLISILNDMGIHEEIRKVGEYETESIDEFYCRVKKHFLNTKKKIVIFIDAIDQISNEDEFLWLPKHLPSNLKIVISVINDSKYKGNSKYYETLTKKTSNVYKLEEFIYGEELLQKLLLQYNRRISSVNQLMYFNKEFNKIKTPLYVKIASEEMRFWCSKKENFKQLTTQQEVIKRYFDNITKIYHHDKEFLAKVATFINFTGGLNENELLEILNTDQKLVEKLLSDSFHESTNTKIPIVIWLRLYYQIKQFVKYEIIDGFESMSFFHREFRENFKSQEDNIQFQNDYLISLLQKLLIKYQDDPYNSNRWGLIYSKVVKSYSKVYQNDKKNEKHFTFISDFVQNQLWIDNFINVQKTEQIGHL